MSQRVEMILDVNEKPKPAQWILLSFQHVFAMFGATILVPVLTGFPISVVRDWNDYLQLHHPV